MGFFDYFLGKGSQRKDIHIQFGRFSDSYKEVDQYDAWDQALSSYENDDYIQSVRSFLHYLKDPSVNNITVDDQDNAIAFSMYQGSKLLEGDIDGHRLFAEAKIAKTKTLPLGMMRRLLDENYQLKYCRYALDEHNNITITFTSQLQDASPYKLYAALKELATRADKKDYILIEDFPDLDPINTGHIRVIDEPEKKVKYSFFIKKIRKALAAVDNCALNLSKHPGAEAYIYLDLIYKIDYLIKPEGRCMEVIDEVHSTFFQSNSTSPAKRNSKIRRLLESLLDVGYEDFAKEIYEVKSTFGIVQSAGLRRTREFISSEVGKMDWYYENLHEEVANAIAGYIIGYSLYSYSIPAPMRDLFGLYYQIVEHDYFDNLGISERWYRGHQLSAKRIKTAIRDIERMHSDLYPSLKVKKSVLDFANISTFSKSFLVEISHLDFSRIDKR